MEHALNFKLWNIFLFSNLSGFSKTTLQKERVKVYNGKWFEQAGWCRKYFLKDMLFDWEIVFPKWGKSGQFSNYCIEFQCGQRVQNGFEVNLVLVGPYSLPWYFIEKLIYYCVYLNFLN